MLNEQELLRDAEIYFDADLRSDSWKNLSEKEKLGALKLAQLDVEALLQKQQRLVDLTNNLILGSIFEQAIHLVIQQKLLRETKEVVSERIDGIGEQSYVLSSNQKEYYLSEKISSRTLSLLSPSCKRVYLER